MKITVFGTGYVGLVQGAVLAEAGHLVTCVDIDKEKISKLKDGDIPIYEPGLESIVKTNYSEQRLVFTTDAQSALNQTDVVFIAVGTPPDEDGSADLRHVLKVAQTIGQYLQDYAVIVNKSTVPVGTADKVREEIQRSMVARGAGIEFDVVSNPEFLKEGAAVADCQ